MAAKTTRETHENILQELQQERVAALTRISRTLEALIDQMHAVRARIDVETGPTRAREVETYRALREEAVKYRWYLEVQREAMGIRVHHRLDEFYEVPGPL